MLIVAGIDGTGSKDWFSDNRNYSHVDSFIRDVNTKGGYKAYWHGPNLQGTDSWDIYNKVYAWIKGVLLKSNNIDNIEIVLVGHSRGAAIVMDIAKTLKKAPFGKKVLFMGLYDSVDRSWQIGNWEQETKDDPTIVNTSTCYHAMRHLLMLSRYSFENTGLHSSNPQGLIKKYFYTSHGGMGGAPGLKEIHGWGDWLMGDTSATPNKWNRAISYYKGEDVRKTYVKNSIEVDYWIREGAKSVGIQLFNSHRSLILNAILADLITEEKQSNFKPATRRINNRIVGRKYGEPPF